MPWVRLDDTFYDNPVNRALGPAGRDLFVASLAHCNQALTNGRIAKGDVPLVLAKAQAKPALVAKLVDAGRWIDRGDHYEVDRYLDYQKSKEQVLAERDAAKERQARYRNRRHGVTNGATNDRSSSVRNGPPDPSHPGPPRGPGDGITAAVDLEHPDTPRLDPEQQAGNVTAIRQIRRQQRPQEPA